jgi:phenylglyoxylate dehydrogenase epsilon subunit
LRSAGYGIGEIQGMAKKKHLIIGAGPAALSALEEIRRITSEDEVKLVTREAHPPYSPASLPYLLSGKITEAALWMRGENYFVDLRSSLVRGKEVKQVVPEQQKVVYSDGTSENYDTLLIASGAEPTIPLIEGLEEGDVQNFRTLADCQRLMQALTGKKEVAVLGAGMMGIKIAVALHGKGYRVSIIEKEPGLLPLHFDEEVQKYIRDIFTEQKIHLYVGTEITSVQKKGERTRITLPNGAGMDADVLINATGVKSRVSFLEGTGIKINKGIRVDRRMGTGADHIYAAGDVAEAHDFFTNEPKMNAIIPSAVSQGKVAGANMAGGDAQYEGGIPMAAISFAGNNAFSLGLIAPQEDADLVLKQKDDKMRRFKKLVFSGERLIGGMFLNEKIDPGLILHLIKKRINMASHKEALFEGTKPLTDPWLISLKFSPMSGRR